MKRNTRMNFHLTTIPLFADRSDNEREKISTHFNSAHLVLIVRIAEGKKSERCVRRTAIEHELCYYDELLMMPN